ncbi:MAG: hypothetical protein P8X46_07090, partial [Nitrospirales bacterium]
MKFLKFVGWLVIGLLLLTGLVYGLFPTFASMAITRILTNHGFENVIVHLGYPSSHALPIKSLSFNTPAEAGSTSVNITKTEITYSLDSLLNNVLDAVNIEHLTVAWDTSVLKRPSSSSPSFPTQKPDSQFDLTRLRSGAMLPVLPFRHLHVKKLDIFNHRAPPSLQQISASASIDSVRGGYKGAFHLEGEGIPVNLLTFSFQENGIYSLTGTHTNTPEDPVVHLETSMDRSLASLMLKGQTVIKLHPFIQTLGALYPIPSEYHSLTGRFSGNWTGSLHATPSQSGSSFGTIQGDFSLEANMPTWPSFVQDLRLLAQGTFSMDDRAITIVVHPSSSGTLSLSLDSSISPALDQFFPHQGLRQLAWNIRQPVYVVIPIKQGRDAVRIPTGQIQIAMHNSSEDLDTLFSPKGLLWEPSRGIIGKADVIITSQLRPASTPSLHMETLSLEVRATIMSSADHFAVTLNPSSFFRLSNLDNATLHIPALESRFPKGLAWTYHTSHQTWELETAVSSLFLPSLSLQGRQWEFQEIVTKDLAIQSTPERWVMQGETEVKQVHIQSGAMKIPDSNWQARYSANPTSLTVQYSGQTLLYPLRIGGQIRFDLSQGKGVGTVSLSPIQFAPQALVLSQLIQPWPFPEMDVTHGTLSASGEVNFRKGSSEADKPFHLTRLHGIVDCKKIGGFVKPTIMEGLTTRVEILGERDTVRIPPTPLHIKHILSAVGLTDTTLIFSSEP